MQSVSGQLFGQSGGEMSYFKTSPWYIKIFHVIFTIIYFLRLNSWLKNPKPNMKNNH